MTGKTPLVKLVSTAVPSGSAMNTQLAFTTGGGFVAFDVHEGGVMSLYWYNGSYCTEAPGTYNSSTHVYLRLRESAGTI